MEKYPDDAGSGQKETVGFSGCIKLRQFKCVAVWETLGEQRRFTAVLIPSPQKVPTESLLLLLRKKGGHLGDVPVVSGASCKSPKSKHLSGSSRLVTFSSPAENCLADVVGKGGKGDSALVLLFLINIPRLAVFYCICSFQGEKVIVTLYPQG